MPIQIRKRKCPFCGQKVRAHMWRKKDDQMWVWVCPVCDSINHE